MSAPNRNAHFKVLNIQNTGDRKCRKCDGWLDHWYNYSGSRRGTCAIVPCGNPAEVGAHIQIDEWRHDFS